jgi:rhodanese-related sulfurtransferase
MVAGLNACTTEQAAKVAAGTIIDVRTAEEYAAGHLEGAINIDVESGDFEQLVSELDLEGEYQLYCRSGRRSAIATEKMLELGFTSVTDLGSLEEASAATGIAITP